MKLGFNWSGDIEINGHNIKTLDLDSFKNTSNIDISLSPKNPQELVSDPLPSFMDERQNRLVRPSSKLSVDDMLVGNKYRITVKRYMTKKATPDFDFMQKFNDDVPMPFMKMTGTIIRATNGMFYMNLYGDITQEKTLYCMKCGRPITNPVSQYFGLGPECGGHSYVNPFESDQELRNAVEEYKKKLNETTWLGWVIKSAITEVEEVHD